MTTLALLLAVVTNSFTITWQAPEATDVSHYHIFVSKDGNFRQDDPAIARVMHRDGITSYTNKITMAADADNWWPSTTGRGIWVMVRAVDFAGNQSPDGNIVQYRDMEPPPAITTTQIVYK